MTEFDLDKIRKYDAVSYDEDRVFLTEKHADLGHGWNPHATEYVKQYSDAAKDPDSQLPIPKKLYGDVIVLSRERLLEWITDSTKQLNELKHAIEWRHPFRASD
jgi:hypothetical protein